MDFSDFGAIFLINLDSRKDRLEKSRIQCQKYNISFERVAAIDGNLVEVPRVQNKELETNVFAWNKFSAALLQTTIGIIEEAKKRALPNILILEDDFLFESNCLQEMDRIHYPVHWSFFYLGYYAFSKSNLISSNLVRLQHAFGCHAYAINSKYYDEYLEKLNMRDRPIDWVIADFFQKQGTVYAPKASLVSQYANQSNIRKGLIDYDRFFGGIRDTEDENGRISTYYYCG